MSIINIKIQSFLNNNKISKLLSKNYKLQKKKKNTNYNILINIIEQNNFKSRIVFKLNSNFINLKYLIS